MRIVCLDLSLHTGYAVMEGEPGCEKPTLLSYGTIDAPVGVLEEGEYPWCYVHAIDKMAEQVTGTFIDTVGIDVVVIEETNKGKNRWSQKALEWLHYTVLKHLWAYEIAYLNTSDWRKVLNLKLTKDQKKDNAKLSKAKRTGVSKRSLGIKGKITPKHLAVMRANEVYDLELKVKDNNTADAIMLGLAYFAGATPITKKYFQENKE